MMIEELVGKTIVFLNNIQLAHWQTKGYAEHEALGEYYTNLNKLNDKLVEAWQGNQNKRIHIESGQHTLQNYQSPEHTKHTIVEYATHISAAAKYIDSINEGKQYIDIESVLEEMSDITSQVQYHLSLK